MLLENITHPLVSDFLTRISGYGDTYLSTESSSRLNDFTKYIGSITADNGNDFAFYPLRPAQNVPQGNEILGIGNMATGVNIVFPLNINRTESGINLNSIKNCGLLDFSGKIASNPRFQFRNDEVSIFYFLKHNRPKFENALYRPGRPCPYFWFDNASDNFGVLAPEFSTSQLRTIGTTYIYDEIYGGDKKGYQVDFTAPDTVKYSVYTELKPTGQAAVATGIADIKYPPVSFYEIDNNDDKFVCINAVFKKYSYSIRSFFGRDYRVLTGFFPEPSINSEETDPVTQEEYINHYFPSRMVIGAGVENESDETSYNIDGLEHICAGLLIMQGDYSVYAKNIAENMAEAIGIKIRETNPLNTAEYFGNSLNDNLSCNAYINSINYYDYTTPILYETYSDYDDILKFSATIYSGAYIDYGRWSYKLINNTTGELRSPERADLLEIRGEVNDLGFSIGLQNIYPPVFGSYFNRGVIGFVSGENENNVFSRFTEQTESGSSGFFLTDNSGKITGQIFFPPRTSTYQQYVTGYISGVKNSNNIFIPFDEFSTLYSSGYFIDGIVEKYPKIQPIPQYINGYISGFLFSDGLFSGFNNNSILSSSGYFFALNSYNFLPEKIINTNPVTGFLIGLRSGDYFSGFHQNDPIDGLYSGVFANNDFSNPGEVEPIISLYFPTGSGLFSGFTGIYGFDEVLGFEYTGFFNQELDENGDPILDENENPIVIAFNDSSGFVDIGPGPYPNTTISSVTGLVGYRNFLNFSGTFNGFDNINFPSTEYGYEYSGFFAGPTGFVGIEIDPITQEIRTEGSGILTGLIGYINTFDYINLNEFSNDSNFPIGGLFTGFSFPLGSGFSGLNNATGTGIQTGIIGSKNYLMSEGEYSGFSGFSNFTKAFLNEIDINFSFPNGNEFSGIYSQEEGIGILSGLITTGKSPLLFGDPLLIEPLVVSLQYASTIFSSYVEDLNFTGVIAQVTGIAYSIGTISINAVQSGTLETGDSFITGVGPEIVSLNYFSTTGDDAVFETFDPSSIDYITRLEAYEGQKLESGVRTEINKFISGLKTDNIWNKITDASLMAGPRTHSGIFIPLKNEGKTGIAYNFVSGDYSRVSGLLGDGISKYIDTTHNLNQENPGSQHMAVYITKTGTSSNQYYIGAGIQSITGSSAIYASGSNTLFQKSRASGIADYGNFAPTTGLMATSRFNTGVWVARNTNISETAFVYVENGAQPSNIYVFANNPTSNGTTTPEEYSDARIAMYSVGINVDILKNYENRMIDYLNGIKNYIN